MKPVACYLFLMLLFCSVDSYGQGENNIWCLGTNRGLDFNSGSPVLYPSALNTVEGCATVCDAAGNLIFYASPITAFDRNHNVMPNGTGLIGSISTTQGAAIIRSYTDTNQYYLFTLTEIIQAPGHLYYSVIDMTLNGGMGDVIPAQKNILLDSFVSEKMAVVRGAGCSQWLLVHHRTLPEFHAFKVDAGGVDPNPVVSTSGFFGPYNVGEMKVSQDHSRVALVSMGADKALELHSIDNATGMVSNAMLLDPNVNSISVCFSPDGSKLYTSNGVLNQFDLSLLPNVPAVIASETQVANGYASGMRVGPDGKMYLGLSPTYGVVNNPNLAGAACNFALTAIASGVVMLGSEFVPNYNNLNNSSSHDTTVCLLDTLTVLAPAGYSTYLWSDGKTTQTDTFLSAGTKWVISTSVCDVATDTFHVHAEPIVHTVSVKDTAICLINNIPVFSAPAGYTSYQWSDGKTSQNDTMSQAGTKWVISKNSDCDKHVDTFHVHDWRDTMITVRDTSHCVAYSPITIYGPAGYTSYLWSDGVTTQSDTFFTTSTKWVRALNGCNLRIDTVHFTATTVPQDSTTMFGGDTTLCFENVVSVSISAPGGYTYYLWSDGNQVQTNAFTSPGTKWVYAQKLCSLLVDTFHVFAQGTDTSTQRTDTFICFSTQATIDAPAGYLSYLWSDGNTGQSDTFSNNGIKYVEMHKACEQAIDTFHVSFVNGLSVELGNDTALCKGEALQLTAITSYPGVSYLWQDNSTAAVYSATEGGDYSVKVSVGPCAVYDTVRVHQKVINTTLGSGKVPCGKDEITLDAGVDSSSYLWQDGSTSRTFKATKAGTYTVKVTQGLCHTTAKVDVQFEGCPCKVVIPTGFSPNNDGKNDKFGATVSCALNSYKLMVYNRWGQQVFYTEHVTDKWDGSVKGVAVDGDVYHYYLEFKDSENKVYYYKGDITLVR